MSVKLQSNIKIIQLYNKLYICSDFSSYYKLRIKFYEKGYKIYPVFFTV